MSNQRLIYYNVKGKKLVKRLVNEYPSVLSNQILFKINYCGVCGSDLAMLKIGSDRINSNTILGHEIVGTVIKVGKSVKNKNLINNKFCLGADIKFNCLKKKNVCKYCKNDNANLCIYPKALGHEINGGFASFLLIDHLTFKNTPKFKIPKGVKLHPKYALTEPLACCINAFNKVYDRNKNSILIFGLGPMGYLLGKLAINLGYKKIIYIESNSKRKMLVKNLNEKNFILIKDFQSLKKSKIINNINQVFVACKSIDAVKCALSLGLKNYQVNLFSGIKIEKKIGVSADFIHYNQITITGTHGSTFDDFKKAFKMLLNKKIEIKKNFITLINLNTLDKFINKTNLGSYLKLIIKN